MPVGNARVLIHDLSRRGLNIVWKKTHLPDSYLPAVQAALDVIAQTELDGLALDPQRYARRIIERILTQYESLGINFDDDDLEYLLNRVRQLPPASVNLH